MQQKAHAAEVDDAALGTRCIVFVFAAVGKQMAFVVAGNRAVGADEIHAVVRFSAVDNCHAANDGGIVACAQLPHTSEYCSAFGLGNPLGLHTKPGGKHFGQDVDVG